MPILYLHLLSHPSHFLSYLIYDGVCIFNSQRLLGTIFQLFFGTPDYNLVRQFIIVSKIRRLCVCHGFSSPPSPPAPPPPPLPPPPPPSLSSMVSSINKFGIIVSRKPLIIFFFLKGSSLENTKCNNYRDDEAEIIFYSIFSKINYPKFNIIPVLQGGKVTSGQIYPLFFLPGGKVAISARCLLCLPAKLE